VGLCVEEQELGLEWGQKKKRWRKAGCRWLKPVILATQEAEIRRITIQGQPGQIVELS
jgi:hypothetical protein